MSLNTQSPVSLTSEVPNSGIELLSGSCVNGCFSLFFSAVYLLCEQVSEVLTVILTTSLLKAGTALQDLTWTIVKECQRYKSDKLSYSSLASFIDTWDFLGECDVSLRWSRNEHCFVCFALCFQSLQPKFMSCSKFWWSDVLDVIAILILVARTFQTLFKAMQTSSLRSNSCALCSSLLFQGRGTMHKIFQAAPQRGAAVKSKNQIVKSREVRVSVFQRVQRHA